MEAPVPSDNEIEKFLSSIYRGDVSKSAHFLKRFVTPAIHPVMTWAALKYVMRLPMVKVDVQQSERAKAKWMFDSRRPWRLHGFTSSYIELPTPIQMFWRGTAKQNLRTRTSQALAAGLYVRSVETSAINDVISQVFRDRGWDERDVEMARRAVPDALSEVLCVGVFDSSERAIGFCLGTQAGNVVRTLWSCTSQRGTSRWLCFGGYVAEAYARGARFIVESPPWAFTGGNHIFADHLGFTPARIRT